MLDPADLLHPRSAVSGSTDIEIRDSKHLFLRQSLFSDKLRGWIESKRGDWPLLVTSIALKWLDEGLQDRGITRDLAWGVPVNAWEWGPNPEGQTPDIEGLAGKVFYVWFDAPIEYIAATWEWADARAAEAGQGPAEDEAWERWWRQPAAADVKYVQFMGKDNVPFHTVGFPCTLMGVNETVDASGRWSVSNNAPWKLVDELKGFNWLDYYGGKFSTSQGRGVFMDHALELLPAGLLALVGHGQCAGDLGRHLRLGAVPGAGERRSGRRAGQLRQPHLQVHRDPLRRHRAGWRRARRAGRQATGRRRWPSCAS